MSMMPSRLSTGILLSVFSLFLAFASLAWSDKLNHYLTDFHGYSYRTNLNLPNAAQTKAEDIRLILPAFNSCADSCPANLMLARQVLETAPDAVGLVVLSIQPEQDFSALLNRYAQVTGREPALLDKSYPASWSLLARHEQIRKLEGESPLHAGHLYVYQHSSQTLLTYPVPDTADIIRDIHRLKTGAKHG